MTGPRSVHLGKTIAQQGLSFKDDGDDVLALLRIWDTAAMREHLSVEQRQLHLFTRLMEFAALLNWRHEDLSDEHVEFFLNWMANFYVQSKAQ